MSVTSKHRRYQFSLRTLMIVVTIGILVLGGRIEYLRRRAAFHEREADRHLATVRKDSGLSADQAVRFAELAMNMPSDASSLHIEEGRHFSVEEKDLRAIVHHRRVAQQFRQAIYRPWTWTHERDTPW